MRCNYRQHFWNWFQYNSQLILHLPEMEEADQEFWRREILVHIRAFSKKLNFELIVSPKGEGRLALTTNGNLAYFALAESVAAKAPAMKGWKVFGGKPPGFLNCNAIPVKSCNKLITIHDLWFHTPVKKDPEGKLELIVYCKEFDPLDPEVWEAVNGIVEELVGEKNAAESFGYMELQAYEQLTEKQRNQLTAINHLPVYWQKSELSTIAVNAQGVLVDTKRPA